MQDREIVFTGRRFLVERVVQETANGPRAREVIRHNGSVVILPLFDDGRVCLIRNFRVSVGQTLIELPAGTLEAGEDPELCAARELVEETGFRAARLRRLHGFFLAPGILDERMHLYLATGLVEGEAAREEGEEITNFVVPWREALAMIFREEICDAKTILSLLYYEQLQSGLGHSKEGP